MIYYETGRWSLFFVFRCQGSVFPRAAFWAFPSSFLAVLIHYFVEHDIDGDKIVTQAWFAIKSVVGFLIVFRTQQGYSRYWEGASLLQSVKAYWLNATSNLVAFCTTDPDMQDEVERFQHLLVRLVSLLHCSALQTVSMMHDSDFEVIELSGLSAEYVNHVHSHEHNKCFIVLQSVQQLVVEHIRNGTLDIQAPIVSRVFQELSNGIVALTNVRKITDIPFPFPYAQLVSVMLIVSSFLTPFITGLFMSSASWAGLLTFISQFAFWSINYIAAEIEMPFGDDDNDLPIDELQREMNDCLTNLLHPLIEKSPCFTYQPHQHKKLVTMRSTAALEGASFLERMGKRGCVYAREATTTLRGLTSVEVDDESPRIEGEDIKSPSAQEREREVEDQSSRSRRIQKDLPPISYSSRSEGADLRYPKDIKDIKSNKDAKDVEDGITSENSLMEMCRLEVAGEHESPRGAPSPASPYSVLVEIQQATQPAKEPKFMEEKSPGRLAQMPFLEDGGICQQLSMQSSHIEALLERITIEVEQIRADGYRLSTHLVGHSAGALHQLAHPRLASGSSTQ